MTISARPIAFFADFSPMRALRWIFAAAVVAAVAAPSTTDARQGRVVRAGAYDGGCSVGFDTIAGNCSSNNSVPFTGSGRRVSTAGRCQVTRAIGLGGKAAAG